MVRTGSEYRNFDWGGLFNAIKGSANLSKNVMLGGKLREDVGPFFHRYNDI